jgi:hypothetical protein
MAPEMPFRPIWHPLSDANWTRISTRDSQQVNSDSDDHVLAVVIMIIITTGSAAPPQ